tara:strand:+ start:644 stop:1930 length:1287 start_codon:yes stop_codon:yes gene_type:complete
MFIKKKINIRTLKYVSILVLIKVFFGFYLVNYNPDFFFTPDSARYVDAAKEICETGKFNDAKKAPEIIRTPGTSLFLLPAVCFDINLKIYIIFLNSIMLLLTAFFTFKIIKLININTSSLFVFLIFLIDPTLFRYQYHILSEIIFLFWFTLALYFLITGLKNINFFNLLIGFIIITLGTFIKPIILYLPYYLFACFILFYLFNSSFRSKFKYSLFLASIIGLIIHFSLTQIWTLRNYKVSGINEFTYIKTVNIYYYMTAGIIAKSQKKDFSEVQKQFLNKTENFSENELVDYSKSEFRKAILEHPLEAVRVGLEGALMTLFSPGTGQYASMLKITNNYNATAKFIFNFFGFFWLAICCFLSIFGATKIERNIFFVILVLIFLYLIIVSSGPMSYSRFRIPFIPIIVVFISCGYENLLKIIKNLKKNNQ